ncbi:MAG: hypothetical protein RDV48_23390 [Candidatus Eremiobacteraeota bacterium]|nr:hypothetical protein [Candidatus Eremiobacteraeota bacterium]
MKRTGAPARERGLSLAELIIGLFLFAIAIIPIFGIIPTAYMSIKKAEDYSAASCYAQSIIELYRITNPDIMYDQQIAFDKVLNNTEYHVVTDLYGRDPQFPHKLMDVVVNIYWKKIPERVTVYSRIFYNN